jgi:hypothetical protein
LIDARHPSGEIHKYTLEWEAATQLVRQGVTAATLKSGDHVIITGNPARNGDEHRLRLRTIVRPKDGWRWRGAFE